jgi:hypothetical protein
MKSDSIKVEGVTESRNIAIFLLGAGKRAAVKKTIMKNTGEREGENRILEILPAF